MITFDKILCVQGLEEYSLVPEILELYCGRGCKSALLLDLDIKAANYGKPVFHQMQDTAAFY